MANKIGIEAKLLIGNPGSTGATELKNVKNVGTKFSSLQYPREEMFPVLHSLIHIRRVMTMTGRSQ